jgi:hypothetical protein
MPVLGVVVGEEQFAEHAGLCGRLEVPGKTGQYFRVLKTASEYGLSFDTCGREWESVIFRSARSWLTGFDVIEVPLSAWM